MRPSSLPPRTRTPPPPTQHQSSPGTGRPIPAAYGGDAFHSSFKTPSGRALPRFVEAPMLMPDADKDVRSCSAENVIGITPSTLRNTPSPYSIHGSISRSPMEHMRRSASPFSFIPIPEQGPARFTSPSQSPYQHDYGKESPSPSMMSIMSTDTLETASVTLESRFASPTPVLLRISDRDNSSAGSPSPRPKTPNSLASSASSNGRKSSFKSDESDLVRKSRIKTELCMHFANGRPCPFGSNCTYAHGEEELQMTKLLDLHKAGLIDMETYRTKPCWTWVTTGSCPFGKRCTAIHDPRIGGTTSSWLPLTETQGNTMATDINVESLHQKRLNEILFNNPFGANFALENDQWSDLYRFICDIDYSKQGPGGGTSSGGNGPNSGAASATSCESGWIDSHKRPRQLRAGMLDPIYKLQIALIMRGNDSDWNYKYRPQHIIHDELCMVLQKRVFCITSPSLMSIQEIPLNSYKPRHDHHILVREIAFGPDADTTVRGVALWFNIEEKDVTLCTPQQAKRFRWKRSIKKEDEVRTTKPSIFESLDSFNMIRPHDPDAFLLATDIMKHRLAMLRTERMVTHLRDRFEALQQLNQFKQALQQRFELQRAHWTAWAWPINHGREKVDKSTPVPPVDGKYELVVPDDGGLDEQNRLGAVVKPIWDGFVNMRFEEQKHDTFGNYMGNSFLDRLVPAGKGRLPIFEALSQGTEISFNRSLPHIHKRMFRRKEPAPGTQEERCWKALLLMPNGDENNEWELVRDHFEKSRSKKVLTIIQHT